MKVVHIGFPKTATSFLQKAVFSRLPDGFTYIDAQTTSAFFAPLMNYDDTIFDFVRLRERFAQICANKKDVLFSYEPLTGLHHGTAFVNRTLIAKRLQEVGFERAIVTIRNQFDALESAYKQYVKSGGVLKFDDYIKFDSSEARYFYPEYFEYYLIYLLYAETFGHSNVLVLQFENLEKSSFLNDMFRFLETKPFEVDIGHAINPSLSCQKTKILRLINHATYNALQPSHLVSRRISTAFFHRQLSRMPLLNGRSTLLSPHVRDVIESFYAGSNRNLEESAGIALSPEYP